jgi:hypothetical protein
MSERHIQTDILLALGGRPDLCTVWRNNTGKARPLSTPDVVLTYGLEGSADILGLMADGRFLAVEVKSETGRQSEQQRRFEAMVTRHGGLYVLARSAAQALAAVEQALGRVPA